MVSASQNGTEPSGCIKWVGISKLCEELSASQERLYYVELVNLILLRLIHDLVYAEFCSFLHWLRPAVNETIYTQLYGHP